MENKIKEVCKGYFTTYIIYFKDKLYYVRTENDDFNNFELTINDKDSIKVDDDLYKEIESYIEEEKII